MPIDNVDLKTKLQKMDDCMFTSGFVLYPNINRVIVIENDSPVKLVATFNELGIMIVDDQQSVPTSGTFELVLRNTTSKPIIFPENFRLISMKANSYIVYDPQTLREFIYPANRPYDFL